MLRRGAAGAPAGVYLTEYDGVPFWLGRLEDWSNNDSDNPFEEELVPVVLKVHTLCKVTEDPHGTRDAGGDAAVICPRPIQPGAIRVWNGKKWVKLDEDIDLSLGVAWVEDEDFDEGGFFQILDWMNSGLSPFKY